MGILADGNGGSELAWHYRDVPTETNTGHREHFPIATPADLGVFNEYVFCLRANSGVNSADGKVGLWMKRPSDIDFVRYHYSITEQFNIATNGTSDGWKNGYLLGWANSGYNENTIFEYDDIKFGKTASSIGFQE